MSTKIAPGRPGGRPGNRNALTDVGRVEEARMRHVDIEHHLDALAAIQRHRAHLDRTEMNHLRQIAVASVQARDLLLEILRGGEPPRPAAAA